MKNPPAGVKLVMAAVCVMKDVKPDKINDPSGTGGKILDYWGPSKKILGDMNFLNHLKEYDKDNIPVSEIYSGLALTRENYVTQRNDAIKSNYNCFNSQKNCLCEFVAGSLRTPAPLE